MHELFSSKLIPDKIINFLIWFYIYCTNLYIIFLVYRSLIHENAFGLVIIVIIACIVITLAVWLLFICRARKNRSSSLINNSADNKSLSSTNSKDSGTGESPKRSQEQLYNDCKYSGLNYEKNNLWSNIIFTIFIRFKRLSTIRQRFK